jgi:hypothetical protein
MNEYIYIYIYTFHIHIYVHILYTLFVNALRSSVNLFRACQSGANFIIKTS